MENKSFKWLLRKVSTRRARLNILDAVICSEDRIAEEFFTDGQGYLKCNITPAQKIRHWFNCLVDSRCPLLREFRPEKFICLIYYQKSVKLVSVREVNAMTLSRILSMKIRSIHSIPPLAANFCLYRVEFSPNANEGFISYSQLIPGQKSDQYSKDTLASKIRELTLSISEFLYKTSSCILKHILFDMGLDNSGTPYIVKTHNISIQLAFKNSIKENVISKPTQISNNSLQEFIRMIGKNVEKTRKMSYKDTSKLCECNSIDELLEQIKYTRPPVWNRDVIKLKPKNLEQNRTFAHRKSTPRSVLMSKYLPNEDKARQFSIDAVNRKLMRSSFVSFINNSRQSSIT